MRAPVTDDWAEWNNKAAGANGFGSAGGSRAMERLRLVSGELQVADVRAQVMRQNTLSRPGPLSQH